jgi:hypothetical protein
MKAVEQGGKPIMEEEALLEMLKTEEGHFTSPFPPDLGPALPAAYRIDTLCLMIQSPFRLYAYWELTPKYLKKTLRNFPRDDRSQFQLIIRCFPAGMPASGWYDVGTASHWWFDVSPDVPYQVQLCLFSPDYGVIPVLSSNQVRTPRASLGPAPTGSEENPATLALLGKLVQLTGLEKETLPESTAASPLPCSAPEDAQEALPPRESLSQPPFQEEQTPPVAIDSEPLPFFSRPTSPGDTPLPE